MSRKIGVFLSSRTDVPEAYRRAVEEVGAWIGRTGRTLVYGGARKGLMEVLARTAKDNGARVYGVVPQIIEDRGFVSDVPDVVFRTADLNDRKAVMVRESDAMVALPGGIGTLDEVFTVLAADLIGTEHKPLVLYNAGGCWDPLLALLSRLQADGLIATDGEPLWRVARSVDELERCLDV